jgi:CheY-like chemotaxis protein
LPVKEHQPDTIVDTETEGSRPGGTETILLVDDEEYILDFGEHLLSKFGYHVLTATDGESALNRFREGHEQIDLVILDLIMPGMGGRKCLDKLLKISPRTKVLVASGYAFDGTLEEAVEAGARGFIGKPYEIKQMLQVIREVLDKE